MELLYLGVDERQLLLADEGGFSKHDESRRGHWRSRMRARR